MIEPTENTVRIYRDRAIKIIDDLQATAAKAEDLRFAARLEAHDLAMKVVELNHLLATRDLRIAELESQLAALERPQPGDFVAGVILDTEGNTTYRVGKWPRPAAPTLQEKP